MKRRHTFWIDTVLGDALKTIKKRDGIPESEQLRRAIAAWARSKRGQTAHGGAAGQRQTKDGGRIVGSIYKPKKSKNWSIIYPNGRAYRARSGATGRRRQAAAALREATSLEGCPSLRRSGSIRFEEAAADVLTDYRINGEAFTQGRRAADRETPRAVLRRTAHGEHHDVGRRDITSKSARPTPSLVRKAAQGEARRGMGRGLRRAPAGLERRDQPRTDDPEARVQPRHAGRQADDEAPHPAPQGEQRAHRVLRARAVRSRRQHLPGADPTGSPSSPTSPAGAFRAKC